MWIAIVVLWCEHTDRDEDVILAYGQDEAHVRKMGAVEAEMRDISDRSTLVYQMTESHSGE